MRSRITSIVLILFLALCAPRKAAACDTVENAGLDSTCVVMPFQGRQGVWFDVSTADELRRLRLQVPELQLQLEDFNQIELIRESQLDSMRQAVSLQQGANELLKKTVMANVRDAREAREDAAEAREELNAWYRSPWLWSVAGAVLGGTVTVLLLDM